MTRPPFLFSVALLVLGVAHADSDFARVPWPPLGSNGTAIQMHFAVLLQNAPQAPRGDDAARAAKWPDLGVAMWPLQAVVEQAMEQAPAVREAQANAQAALRDVDSAQSGLWPRVELSANSPAANLDSSGNRATGAKAGANVVYNLVDFGKTRKQIKGRELQSQSLESRLLSVRDSTAFDTANAYLELVKQQRLERIYEAHIGELQTLTGKLTDIVAVFAGRRSELTQAQARLGQANDALLAVQSKKRQIKLELMRLLGSPAHLGSVPDGLPNIPELSPDGLLDAVKQNHPAIRSAIAEAALARALVDEAEATQKPQVDMVLSSQSGLDAAGVAAPTQLYVTAKWVAFDGYGSKSNTQALQARAVAAEARAAQILQEIEFKLQSAEDTRRSLVERANELSDLLRNTDQVRKDYYDQWRELGRRSLLDVLSAENEYLNTQLSLTSSEVDLVLAGLRMRHEASTLRQWLLGNASTTPQPMRNW